MDNLEYKRNYMKKKNATKEGAEYNRTKVKAWRAKQSPEKRQLSRGRYRGKNRHVELREAVIYYLIDRDGIDCLYCGKPVDIDNLHLAHKLAMAFGGKCRLDNYCLAHPECNAKDGIEVHRKVICKDK